MSALLSNICYLSPSAFTGNNAVQCTVSSSGWIVSLQMRILTGDLHKEEGEEGQCNARVKKRTKYSDGVQTSSVKLPTPPCTGVSDKDQAMALFPSCGCDFDSANVATLQSMCR